MNDSCMYPDCAPEAFLRVAVSSQFTQGSYERIRKAFLEQRVSPEERKNHLVTRFQSAERGRALMGVDYADLPEGVDSHWDISDPQLQFFRFSCPGAFRVYGLERVAETQNVHMKEVYRFEHDVFKGRKLDLWHRPFCTFFLRDSALVCGAYVIVFAAFHLGTYDAETNCALDGAICERMEEIERYEIPLAYI